MRSIGSGLRRSFFASLDRHVVMALRADEREDERWLQSLTTEGEERVLAIVRGKVKKRVIRVI
jgi:hypothetical protein